MSDRSDEPRPHEGPFPDGLPDDFTVPDDLSSLLDDAAPATTSGQDGAGEDEPPASPDTSDASGPSTDAVPDDLSSLEEAGEPPLALVVTQVAGAGPLAAACSLASVGVDVVMSPVGALAVLRDPKEAAAAAGAISALLKGVPVILLERRAGQVAATRWTGGERGDELAPGLVLSDAPEVLEDLILGSVDVQELDGVVTSVGMSRWKALRLLAGSRDGRRGGS